MCPWYFVLYVPLAWKACVREVRVVRVRVRFQVRVRVQVQAEVDHWTTERILVTCEQVEVFGRSHPRRVTRLAAVHHHSLLFSSSVYKNTQGPTIPQAQHHLLFSSSSSVQAWNRAVFIFFLCFLFLLYYFNAAVAYCFFCPYIINIERLNSGVNGRWFSYSSKGIVIYFGDTFTFCCAINCQTEKRTGTGTGTDRHQGQPRPVRHVVDVNLGVFEIINISKRWCIRVQTLWHKEITNLVSNVTVESFFNRGGTLGNFHPEHLYVLHILYIFPLKSIVNLISRGRHQH